MKKIFNLILIIMFVFVLFGCGGEVNYKNIIEESFSEINLPNETSVDLDFVKEIEYQGYKILLEWKTSNQAIDENGKVTLGDSDIDVVITLKGTLNNESFEKEIATVKVLKKEEINDSLDLDKALSAIKFEDTIKDNLDLSDKLNYEGNVINLEWTVDGTYVLEDGTILFPETNTNVKISVVAKFNDLQVTKEFNLVILSAVNACKMAALEINIPESINDDIEFVKEVGAVKIDWDTSDDEVLDMFGKCSFVSTDTEITIYAGYYVPLADGGEYFYDVEYDVVVKPYSNERRLKAVEEKLQIPSKIYRNIALNTKFDYDVTGTWKSSNEEVLSNIGEVNNQKDDTNVTLSLELKLGEEVVKYSYDVVVVGNHETETHIDIYQHNIVDRVKDYDESRMNNVELKDGKVVLKGSALEGSYESKIFNTVKFDCVVGSWACITNEKATAELEVSICINGTWTKYFTYGNWGLGLNNLYYNQDDTLAKMSVDEIMVKSAKASAVKYRITLRRDSVTTESPKLSLVAMTLEFTDSSYVYGVTTDILPMNADNDLPKLYQYDVKEVGGSICSATTTTMLLKYKGFDFSEEAKTYAYANTWGVYEHGYMANLVADRGHNSPTFGNWTYNMATAGAFGVDSYVARMYSWDEMREYLANHGPLGCSIKSSNGEFGYTTNGHLIVVRGYRINENGDTIVICNDPAVKSVYYEVTLRQLMLCWRGVVYILE